MAPRTSIVKIGALLLSQFGLLVVLNFQHFWMVTTYKMLLLPSGSHIVSCFSAWAEIPFRLNEMFSDFLACLAGLKILATGRTAKIYNLGDVKICKNKARIFSLG